MHKIELNHADGPCRRTRWAVLDQPLAPAIEPLTRCSPFQPNAMAPAEQLAPIRHRQQENVNVVRHAPPPIRLNVSAHTQGFDSKLHAPLMWFHVVLKHPTAVR